METIEYNKNTQESKEYQISDFSYNQILQVIITELYINRQAIRDKKFFTYLIHKINRESSKRNVNPKYFFERFTDYNEVHFSKKIIQLETEIILESENLDPKLQHKLKQISLKIIEKGKYFTLADANKVILKGFENINSHQILIYSYNLWKYYLQEKI